MVGALEEAMKYERVELAKSFESPSFADIVQAMPGNSIDKKTKKSQWQWEEDKILINAWLNVSMDHVIGTDQKSDAFWIRVHRYCEERNPGSIKRGQTAMKKRWHRINQGALGFGGCYDQASQKIGSDANTNNIMELAHQLFLARYQKKCNFDQHWSELRKEQKWRTPSKWSPSIHSGGSKRTKISACGVYSSSSNPETPAAENAAVESPVCPKGTAVAKREDKGKSKASDIGDIIEEEIEAIKSSTTRQLSLIEELKIVKQREMDMKEMELEMQLLTADTSLMNEMQREIHAKMLEKIKAKYS